MASISNLTDLAASTSWVSNSSVTTTRAGQISSIQDQVELATVPPLASTEQLQTSGPSYQAVLGDAVRTLRAAASQSSDPIEAAYLLGLAGRFQHLLEAEEVGVSSASA